jgi:uncharacterized membrane protein YraQ (UPF0718 family)
MIPAQVTAVAKALRIGGEFLWRGASAIIMGLVVTSLVQIYVSKERMAAVLCECDAAGVTRATPFGAASGGCSFGAVAIGKFAIPEPVAGGTATGEHDHH